DLLGRDSCQYTIRDVNTTARFAYTMHFRSELQPSDISATRNGDHLILTINGTTDQLTAYYWFWQDRPDNQVEQVGFDDGTTWDAATIKQKVLNGTAGADTLVGYATADNLSGVAGNDVLFGRAGDDTLDGGPGADTMYGEA